MKKKPLCIPWKSMTYVNISCFVSLRLHFCVPLHDIQSQFCDKSLEFYFNCSIRLAKEHFLWKIILLQFSSYFVKRRLTKFALWALTVSFFTLIFHELRLRCMISMKIWLKGFIQIVILLLFSISSNNIEYWEKKEIWYLKFVHSDKSILQYRSLEKALTRFLILLFRKDIFLLRGLLNILTLPRVYPVKTDSGWICFLVLLITIVLILPQSSGHYSKIFKQIIAFSIWGTW